MTLYLYGQRGPPLMRKKGRRAPVTVNEMAALNGVGTSNLADCEIGTLAKQFHAVEDLLRERDAGDDTIQVNKRGGRQREL